jgi:hypothetical protein
MAGAVYKQSKVIFSVAGVPVNDIAEDSEISVTYDRDRITKQNDINEGGIFSLKDGKPAAIEVEIMPHSPWISILANYRNAELTVPISLSDKNDYGNTTTFIAADAMIQDPAFSYGSDATPRTFRFEVLHLTDVTNPL